MDYDEDVSKELKLQVQTNIDMIIPRYIGPYMVQKAAQETNNSLIITALYKKKKKVAIKCIPIQYFNPALAEILNKLHHTNILETKSIFYYPEGNIRFGGIVMPFIETDLFSYFYVDNYGYLPELKVCELFYDALQAVNYLHSLDYCHSDLKIENFLVQNPKEDPKILLIDFDFTFNLPNNYIIKAHPRGTLCNSAPELLQSDSLAFVQEAEFTNKIDTWSMGVLLYTLLSGVHPFKNEDQRFDLRRIKVGMIDLSDKVFNGVSLTARNLIDQMIRPNPNDRPSIQEVLNHKWFTEVLARYRIVKNVPPRQPPEKNDLNETFDG